MVKCGEIPAGRRQTKTPIFRQNQIFKQQLIHKWSFNLLKCVRCLHRTSLTTFRGIAAERWLCYDIGSEQALPNQAFAILAIDRVKIGCLRWIFE